MKLTKKFKLASRIFLFLYIVLVAFLVLFDFSNGPQVPTVLWGIPTDKIVHFLMFTPYPILLYGSFHDITCRPYGHLLLLLVILVTGCVLAFLTEYAQSFTEYRSAEPLDFLADVTGMFASSFLILLSSAIYHKW